MEIEYKNLSELIKNNKIDFKNQYLNILSKLSYTPIISNEIFFNNLNKIFQNGNIIVALHKKQIIGTGTLFLQPKLSHGGKNIGQIEDIVIDDNYRSLGIGKKIIKKLIEESKKFNCYKIILSCNEDLEKYYEKIDLKKGLLMKLES